MSAAGGLIDRVASAEAAVMTTTDDLAAMHDDGADGDSAFAQSPPNAGVSIRCHDP
jgi:hypothetical protein